MPKEVNNLAFLPLDLVESVLKEIINKDLVPVISVAGLSSMKFLFVEGK